MSNLARLLWSVPKISSPTTIGYDATQILAGFSGPINTTQNSLRIYMRSQLTLWSGWVIGTEAKWNMTSEYGDFDGAVQVAIDGGAFSDAPRATQAFTLFTGLPHAAHFVEVRVANGLGDVSYIASTGAVLVVTGQPPALLLPSAMIQVGADSALGLYSACTVANSAGFTPLLQAPNSTIYGSNVGSVKIKGAFNNLVVSLNGALKVGVSKNGGDPSFYSGTDESGSPTRALVIPCDGSTSTYNVWDDGNVRNTGGVFAVAGDSAFLDIGTRRRIDQYGDSVTYGSGPGATPVNSELMSVAAKLGFVGSTNGISGQTTSGGKTMLDTMLPARVVSSSDVAILALGGNSASGGIDSTEQADYSSCIDKLVAKGYGKVLCRGILPLADSNANVLAIAANATLKSIADGKANPKVIWVDTSTWTGYTTQDGVHPTAAGYVTLAGYAYTAYAALNL